jgi:two-component system nitrate/nitrite response regulator NarL
VLLVTRDGLGVLVVDRERTLAEGLAKVLSLEDTIGETRSAGGALEALRLIDQKEPDVLVMGSEADSSQLAFVREVSRRHPAVAVVVVSASDAGDDLGDLVQAGAMGWVPKSASIDDLLKVVEGVGDGDWWVPRALLGQAVRELSREVDKASTSRLQSLTFRERQVLTAMAEGLPRQEIASRLHLSVNTVRTHIQHLLVKLEVHTSLEAVMIALREDVSLSHRPRHGGSPADRVRRESAED